MTDSDLTLLSDALGIPAERVEAVVSLLRAAVGAEVRAALSAESTAEERVYAMSDVMERVPWSRPTVDKMVKRQQIPMIYIEGRWVITAARFRAAADKGFPVPAGRLQTRGQGRKRHAPDRDAADHETP